MGLLRWGSKSYKPTRPLRVLMFSDGHDFVIASKGRELAVVGERPVAQCGEEDEESQRLGQGKNCGRRATC